MIEHRLKKLLVQSALVVLAPIFASGAFADTLFEETEEEFLPVLRIGYIENSFSPSERLGFEETFAYLQKQLPQYRIELRNYLVKDLENAVASNAFEFFIGASGFYRRVFRRGLKDLATLTTPWAPDPNFAVGTVFMVPKESKAKTVADLKGMRAAVNWPGGFSGVYVPLGEIAQEGFDPDDFFSELVSAGSPMKRLLEAVENKQADVAMARACTVEELQQTEPEFVAKFRPIGLKPKPEGFACIRSTDLYPNWTFVATPMAPWQASRDMTAALLSMPATSNGMGWGVASDFLRVDDLYKTLRVGPYSYLRIRSISDFVDRYWPWMAAAILAVLALILHSRRVSHLVDVRTRELKASIEKERQAHIEIQQTKDRLESLERVSVIGAMSSLITHELNGPVSAISNSCNALERHLDDVENPDKMTSRTLTIVLRQCARITDIVNHVRHYVKFREVEREIIDVGPAIETIVSGLRRRFPGVDIQTSLPRQSFFVRFHRLEFELCLTNLIKNAAEAALSTIENPKIVVDVSVGEYCLNITVTDNAKTDAQALATHTRPLSSGKASGLGLGVLIVRTLVEKSSGHLTIERLNDTTAARITLPMVAENDKDNA